MNQMYTIYISYGFPHLIVTLFYSAYLDVFIYSTMEIRPEKQGKKRVKVKKKNTKTKRLELVVVAADFMWHHVPPYLFLLCMFDLYNSSI